MPVKRIINQVNLKKSDSVILIYGQVNDTFVTGDLALYNVDGIEKVLCRYLHENGYEQIIFYAPERQLYAYDERSVQYCYPGEDGRNGSPDPVAGKLPDNDGRPLGAKKYLRSRVAATATVSEAVATPPRGAAGAVIRWNNREGFIPIARGSDAAVADIIREALFQQKRKSVVVFSQFDNPGSNSEIQRLLLPLIPRLQRRTNKNKCIIITNAVDQEKLREVVDAIPSLNKIVKMDNAGKGLDSLVYIGYPQKDEICNLINRERIIKNKPVNWQQFDRMVTALDQGRDELKRWENDFNELEQIDILNLNNVLPNPMSEHEQSAFKKLDALIGLAAAKKAIRRHLLQIRDMQQLHPQEKPLMHIVLKGNPGTGKTTLARIIAAIFQEEGMLERGHLIEVDREKLVAGYIGQTALKTDSCCRDALGGVLFVDEAYSLAPVNDQQAPGAGSQDFGREAIDTLIKRMTDWQDRFCVILAGYSEDMDRLLAANPGFTGRIGLTIGIEDYRPEELLAIFCERALRSRRIMTDDFTEALLNVFTSLYKKRGKKFDNGRVVEQLFGKINGLHLERCMQNNLNRQEEPYRLEDIPADLHEPHKRSTAAGDARERLNDMIGLEKAKQQIEKQVALIRAEKELPGYARGSRLHLIFTGKPGTGKTTVARLLGEIYQHHELLPNNHFVEVTRADLVAPYQGQTAGKVKEKCKEAMGGVLFIDEAYTLVKDDTDLFGREAVDTLLKIMEDERDKLCVIIAGYPGDMRNFLSSNPGLQRRFSAEIEFDDYTDEQLFMIFQHLMSKKNIAMEEGVVTDMRKIMKAVYDRRDEKFGNAGDIENIVQKIQENLALRCFNQQLPIRTTPVLVVDIPRHIYELLPIANSDEVIAEAMKELESLVGLDSVKNYIRKLVKEYKFEQLKQKHKSQLPAGKRSYHMIFRGNPGTGKTTVARIMGKIFKALDILKKGEVVEVSRPDFIAGYQGQTAEKTRKLIHTAFDKILFIDEAYSLLNEGLDGYGREAIDVLVKMMEDHRDRLVVIAVGYTREMKNLMRANSGLASRFYEINFADYDVAEMVAIFKSMVARKGYQLADNLDSELEEQLNFYKAKKGTDFGNARDIEKFLDNIILPRYRDRVELMDPNGESFWIITREDFPNLNELRGSVEGSGETKAPATGEFDPAQEKREQRNKGAAMMHSGSGDIVMGDKNVTYNQIVSIQELTKMLTDTPPLQGIQVIGRGDVVVEMFSRLFDPQTGGRLLLYGLGGIGKTQTIVKFIQDYQNTFEHIIWLDVNVSLQKTFIENKTLLKNLGIDFTEKDDDAARYARVIARLQEIKKTSLLVIEGLTRSLEKEFEKLLLPAFRIIGSTREKMQGGQQLMLGALEPAAAKALFRAHYTGDRDISKADELLQPVSYHPLAVVLLANIWTNTPDMTFEQLKQRVQQGLHIRKGNIDLSYDTTVGANEEVIDIFQGLFRLVDLSEAEKTFICYFSVLPACPVPRDILYTLFQLDTETQQGEFNDVIVDLKKKGIICEEQGRGLYCHHIIQQVSRDETKPTVQNCAPHFTALGKGLGEKIDAAMAGKGIYELICDYLYLLETFITHFTEEELFFSRVYINLGVLYRVNGQFEESARISKKEKEALEPQKAQYPAWYNIILRNMAYALLNKGAYAEAEKYYREGVDFLEQLDLENEEDRRSIQRELIFNYSQLGALQLRVECHDIPKAIAYLNKGLELYEQSDYEDPLAQAALRENLALAQIDNGESELAIENLKETKKLLIEGENIERNSLPLTTLDLELALAYAGDGNFSEARLHAGYALENIKKHLPEDNMEFYRGHNISAMIDLADGLYRVDIGDGVDENLFQRASESMEKAIEIFEAHRGKDQPDLALMYSNYGLILKYLGNEEKGYQQHVKGLAIYEKMRYRNDLVAAIFLRTILFFEDQVTFEEAEGYLLSCQKFIQDEFENLLSMAFVNYCLGICQHKNGRSREGIGSLHNALNQVRKYYKKETEDTGDDSPLEVVVMQEIAVKHADIGEYKQALQWQEDAVKLCEANMPERAAALAEPYVVLAQIYLKAAKAQDDNKKWFADSLMYKVKAEMIDTRLVRTSKELDECGQLYQVGIKENSVVKTTLVVIPNVHYPQFEGDFRSGKITDLGKYGYKIQLDKKLLQASPSMSDITEFYTRIYGPLNEQFASLE